MTTAVFSIVSPMHDQQILERSTAVFFGEIMAHGAELADMGENFDTYGNPDINLIFIRTGGTEGNFLELYPRLHGPYYLLTSGADNSLAASMEILSFLRSRGERAEIIHGSPAYIASRIDAIGRVTKAVSGFRGRKYGVIGRPSDWLISSGTDYAVVREKTGAEIIDIPMEKLVEEINKKDYPASVRDSISTAYDADVLEGALHIYGGLQRIVDKYNLSGFTLRCFDLLGILKNTGCLALSIMNSRGIIAGCEGDVPSMLSMAIARAVTGGSGFQCNPSRLDVETNEIIFAHCTIPLDMVSDYTYDTHFESGLGVAIRGKLPAGELTIFKASGSLDRYFVSRAAQIDMPWAANLCRTQVKLKPQKSVGYFLKESIGNHHILIPGNREKEIEEFFGYINA